MPGTEQDPIIVTGRFGGGFFSSWGFDPSAFQAGIGSFYVGGLTLASFMQPTRNTLRFLAPRRSRKLQPTI